MGVGAAVPAALDKRQVGIFFIVIHKLICKLPNFLWEPIRKVRHINVLHRFSRMDDMLSIRSQAPFEALLRTIHVKTLPVLPRQAKQRPGTLLLQVPNTAGYGMVFRAVSMEEAIRELEEMGKKRFLLQFQMARNQCG